MTQAMLAGVKVLDLTHYVAGPSATRLMAELGADIIKVELGPMGDPARRMPWVSDDRSLYFIQQNRGKQSLCVDFTQPASWDLIARLAAQVDVVIENFGTGVLERRGLDYASLKNDIPGLIMVSISAFGRDGPWADKTGFDQLAQAMSGLMHLTGEPDRPPAFTGAPIADCSAGMQAFGQIGYALWHRDRTGQGQWIDVALVDSLVHQHVVAVQTELASNGAMAAERSGHHSAFRAPIGSFEGNDGYLVIVALESQWPWLCDAMGCPELVQDERFADADERSANKTALAEIIEDWLRSFPTNVAAAAVLDAHRVPNAPVLAPRDLVDHPFHVHRGSVRAVPDPVLGTVRVPGSPLRSTAMTDTSTMVAPLLGQHNDEVLRQMLGLTDSEIDALRDAGTIVSSDR